MKLQIIEWKHHISLAGDLISKGESAAAILITMTLSSAVLMGFIFPSKPWQIFQLTPAAATAIPRGGFELPCRASSCVTEGAESWCSSTAWERLR